MQARRLIFGMQLDFNQTERNIENKIEIMLRSSSKTQIYGLLHSYLNI